MNGTFIHSLKRSFYLFFLPIFFIMLVISCDEENAVNGPEDDELRSTRDIPANAIPGLVYLGTGYDAFGEYASTNSVMSPVLDLTNYSEITALGKSYTLPQNVYFLQTNDFDYVSTYGRYASEYISSMTQSVSVSGSYGGLFSSTVTANFSEDKYTSSDYAFTTITRRILLWRLSLPFTDIDKLRDMMLGQAREDIKNLDPELLFRKYGTHITTEIYIGARADYHCETEKNSSTVAIKNKIKANAEGSFKKFTGSAEYDGSFEEEVNLFNSNSKTYLRVSGGRSALALQIAEEGVFNEWQTTIEEDPVLCEFTKNSLIPIWELCEDDTRRAQVENAFLKLAATNQLPDIVKKAISDIKVISIGTGNYQPFVDFGYEIITRDLNYDAGGNYIYFQYKSEPEGTEAIDSVGFVFNSQSTPAGWTFIPSDLNSGAGGADIFLCYKKASNPANPIRRLMVTYNNEVIPPDFEVGKNLVNGSPQDLAQGTGNDVYIYLSYSREQPTEDAWGD